jgi:hypothetical protein
MSAFSVTDLAFEPYNTEFWANYRRIKQFYFLCCVNDDLILRDKIEKLEVADNREIAITLYNELTTLSVISEEQYCKYDLSKISYTMSLEDIASKAKQIESMPRMTRFTILPGQMDQIEFDYQPIWNFTAITQAMGRSQRAPATLVVEKELDEKKARRKRIKELKLKTGQIRR